jgi:uncharacterized repeat protein (TIGR02543 family)
MNENINKRLELEINTKDFKHANLTIQELIDLDINNTSLWFQWLLIKFELIKASINTELLNDSRNSFLDGIYQRLNESLLENDVSSLKIIFPRYLESVLFVKEMNQSKDIEKILYSLSNNANDQVLVEFEALIKQIFFTIIQCFPKPEVLDEIVKVIYTLKKLSLIHDEFLNQFLSDFIHYSEPFVLRYLSKSMVAYLENLLIQLGFDSSAKHFAESMLVKINEIKKQKKVDLINQELDHLLNKINGKFDKVAVYPLLRQFLDKTSQLEDEIISLIHHEKLNFLKSQFSIIESDYKDYSKKKTIKTKNFIKKGLMGVLAFSTILFSIDLFLFQRKITIIDPISQREETLTANTFSKISLQQLEKEGFTFGGYYLDEDFTKAFDPLYDRIPYADLTLHIQWIRNKYKINLYDGVASNPTQIEVLYDYSLLFEINAVFDFTAIKFNYYFDGWTFDEENLMKVTSTSKMPSNDLNLYAKWSPNKYDAVIISGVIPKKVARGHNFALILDTQNLLHSFGASEYNLAQGLSTANVGIKSIQSNFVLNSGETIADIFAGYNTSYAITSTNRVFAWGENENGLIGNNSTTDSRLPVNITSYFGSEMIVSISANRYHALALSSSGKIFVWGENDYYVTGDSSSFSRYRTPTEITDLFSSVLSVNEKIVTIEASLKRSHFLSSSSRYFYMGNSSSQLTPILQTTIININSLSYRYDHGIYWNTNSSSNWMWGPSSSSWASWGTTSVFRANERILSADVGLNHTAFITTANRIFTFGNNSDYQLGNNSTTERGLSSSAQLTLPNLYQTEAPIKVYTFEKSTMVLTNYGRLFVFGNNDSSRLGVLNNTSDIRTPSLNSQIFHPQLKVSIGHGTLINPNLPTYTALNGYTFRGYYTNQNLTITVNNATIMPSSTYVIYGKWN